jgi:hypothetical protein
MKTAQEIIQKRRELWVKHHNIERDRDFTESVAEYITRPESKAIRKEIAKHPELLIEMLFVIVDKDKKTVPFFLNEVQREFINDLNQALEDYRQGKRLHLKFLVLKGRQQGFTSVITAYQLACSITQKNFAGFTLADDSDNTETIFEDKAKYPYNQLPEKIKPTEKYNNRREFHFEKLNSRWRVATAGSKGVGRSKTLNFFHGSEAAFWTDLQQMLAGLGQALTKDSIQILESTANGYNEFKDLWDDGQNWEQKFYEWWKTPEYVQQFESSQKEAEFRRQAETKEDWIFSRCKWLIEFIGLTWEQVYWYYTKWLDIKELIKQEYPCSADEAFLASGRCIFNQEKIIQRKTYLEKQQKHDRPIRGEFIVTWNNPDMMDFPVSFKWTDNQKGFISIYEDTKPGYPYVIGGDTKGEGSDKFAGTVINNHTGVRCATLHGEMKSKYFAAQMWAMGMYFNIALLGIETNFNTYPIELLTDWNYPRQYIRERKDTFTGEIKKAYGFKTDGNTRPLIIEKEITTVEEDIDLFNDIPTLNEMLTFVEDEKGRPNAESGKHDDLVFSDMIGNEIRGQQTRLIDKPEQADPDEDEDYRGEDGFYD